MKTLLNPCFKSRAYSLIYENVADSVTMRRAKKSGEDSKFTKKRIEKAKEDRKNLMETEYNALFNEQSAVKMVEKINFEGYMVELSKLIV